MLLLGKDSFPVFSSIVSQPNHHTNRESIKPNLESSKGHHLENLSIHPRKY